MAPPSAPISGLFNPFSSWRCPHCLRSYAPRASPQMTSKDDDDKEDEGAPTIVFLRGSCRHDVCLSCIASSSSSSSGRHRRSRLVGPPLTTAAGRRTSTRSAMGHRDGPSMIVELPCPIDRCGGGGCGGTFVVDASELAGYAGKRSMADHEVIDLCCDDEIVVDDDARGAVKREAEEEEGGEGGGGAVVAASIRRRGSAFQSEKRDQSRGHASNGSSEGPGCRSRRGRGESSPSGCCAFYQSILAPRGCSRSSSISGDVAAHIESA